MAGRLSVKGRIFKDKKILPRLRKDLKKQPRLKLRGHPDPPFQQ